MRRFENLKRLYQEQCRLDDIKIGKLGFYADVIKERILFGTQLEEYISFGFYWRKNRDRRRFILRRQALMVFKLASDSEESSILDSKKEFNQRFGDFIGRDWIDLSSCNFADYKAFVSEHGQAFCKPTNGRFGIGASILTADDITEDRYREIAQQDSILESVIVQHEALASLNSSSVNTIRVITIRDRTGRVHVPAAELRIGRKSSCTDNFRSGGIVALIDCGTGIVITSGVDKRRQRYLYHPDSAEKIIGFQIPEWKQIMQTVDRAAKQLQKVRYVGWDITVDKNSMPIIIEGNANPGHDGIQSTDQIGKWPLFKHLIEQ